MRTETFVIATTAGAFMLALGVALGGGIIPAQLLLLGFGLVGVCATFAYATISIIQDHTPKRTIIEYRQAWEAPAPRRYVYRIEAPDQEEIVEAVPEYLPAHTGQRGPSWIIRK